MYMTIYHHMYLTYFIVVCYFSLFLRDEYMIIVYGNLSFIPINASKTKQQSCTYHLAT